MVGLPGFEPGTSCTPSKRASQAAPQPDTGKDFFSVPQISELAGSRRCQSRFGAFHGIQGSGYVNAGRCGRGQTLLSTLECLLGTGHVDFGGILRTVGEHPNMIVEDLQISTAHDDGTPVAAAGYRVRQWSRTKE